MCYDVYDQRHSEHAGVLLCLSMFAVILLANASIANQSKQIQDRMQIMLLDF